MKLHLVDGTYELFRAYFASPKRAAPDGSETGAVHGLIQTLLVLLRQAGVSHVACAFDTVIESFRNELFSGYKTGEGVPEGLLSQFPLAERAASALGLVVWPMIEFEADDAIATAAARWKDAPGVEQVVICSPDKDLMQLISGNRVVSLDRRKNVTTDEPGVREKFGVGPESIPDYLALVGDSADGIPGVKGWGAKSTAQVLARYIHLESIPDDVSQWTVALRGAKSLAASLAASRDDAALYKRLATLRFDVPLPETLADLEWKGARRDEFQALCDALGFERLKAAPHRWRSEE
ncbi:MAG: flap endonuclease [Chloroflexi bacterium]|nr:flap endonuclease [Chloroflexota bacterium]